MRYSCIFLLLVGFIQGALGQAAPEKPKLVVGIMVDQMRQEYLYRFGNKFGEGGFKRMINEGFMLQNAHYNYAPTYTGPGHASVYSGTTPAIHGIIGNDWYDKETRKNVNCVEDERFHPVGVPVGAGDVSPWRMLSTTITDELKLGTQKRSKVVGISLKDRGAVLPAGHMADGAYWYDGKSGNFITSTYYRPALPLWVEKFNGQKLPDKYLNQEWKTLLPMGQYTESGPDESPYEVKLMGKEKAVFPYKLKELRKKDDFEMITTTPFGDDLLTELAKAAIDGEELGKDEWTDFLAISYSSPDIIGHATGPNSIEVEDTFLRLDKNLEDLFAKLDKEIGKGAYVVFLTSDHAIAEVPQYLKDQQVPAGNFSTANTEAKLIEFLKTYYPDKQLVDKIINEQVFLNHAAFTGDPKTAGVDLLIVTELVSRFLLSTEGVADVFTQNTLRQGSYSEGGMKGMVIRGFHSRRSGDVVYKLEPGWLAWVSPLGTTHGSIYSYDTHVPVLFYGKGIRHGKSAQYHPITDIAPTLSVLLKVKFPSGCTGQPVVEALE